MKNIDTVLQSSEINTMFDLLEKNAPAPTPSVPALESGRPNADNAIYRHQRVSCLIRSLLDQDCLILDTETTGLDCNAEICEITVIDSKGNVLLNSLVRPINDIPVEATRIHGITNEMVVDAPLWSDLHDDFLRLIGTSRRPLVIYNAPYDVRLLSQSAIKCGLTFPASWPTGYNIKCAMQSYAEFYGQWDDSRRSFKWQKLTNAITQCGFPILDAHRALGDCIMTLAVMGYMAQFVGQSK